LQPRGDFSTGDDFFTYFRDGSTGSTAWERRNGPRMMSIGLHGRIIGRPAGSARDAGSSRLYEASAVASARRLVEADCEQRQHAADPAGRPMIRPCRPMLIMRGRPSAPMR